MHGWKAKEDGIPLGHGKFLRRLLPGFYQRHAICPEQGGPALSICSPHLAYLISNSIGLYGFRERRELAGLAGRAGGRRAA